MKKQVIAYLHTHWDREWYREFEIFRIVEGSMLVCSDDVVQEVSAGDIIFINSYYIHEIKPISKYCKAPHTKEEKYEDGI